MILFQNARVLRWLEIHTIALLFFVVVKNSVLYVVSTGQNKYNTNGTSIHAEADAINRLPPKSKRSKNLETVSLLVLKVNKTGTIGNSSPCVHCLKTIATKPLEKGYRIDKIYYSTESGTIECKKLTELLGSEELHISAYYRNHNYDMKKWLKWRNQYLGSLSKCRL
jgi:hypothetical protein